jgi:2-polyprenyl-3-methyl-5-hydroxy-6-metoxy-1,4-benzoquinol methylase
VSATDFNTREYWEQRLAEHDGLAGVGWLGLGESFNRWMYAVRAKSFAWAVRRAAGPRTSSLRVLDVGSGTGFYVDRWVELGARSVTGTDLTEVAVQRLRTRRPGLEVRQMDITATELPADLGPFDAVSAMDVLFHIVDEEAYARAVHNLAALLGPGGLLFLSENLVPGEAERARHQISRGRQEITSLLDDAGLETLEIKPVFWLMNTPLDADGRLLPLWWRAVSRAAGTHDAAGFVLGGMLYGPELLLVRTQPDGPSTKLLVARRR